MVSKLRSAFPAAHYSSLFLQLKPLIILRLARSSIKPTDEQRLGNTHTHPTTPLEFKIAGRATTQPAPPQSSA